MSAVQQLGQVFAATLVPEHRANAEATLEQAAAQPGFLKALFEVQFSTCHLQLVLRTLAQQQPSC